MDNISELSNYWLIALVFIAFSAGYIDAVAGGGGMLNLPALMFVGVPPVSALAINKVTGVAGTTFAVVKYASKKQIHWPTVMVAAIPCFIASYIGGRIALGISANVLAWAILICIPIALFIVITDKASAIKEKPETSVLKTISAITPIGFYDGILGPGTGTYMAIAVRKVLHFDYLLATATIKPLNLLTNIAAAVAFMFAGKVIWVIAIPMILASSAGGWLGSHSAIKGGEIFIRRLLIVVLIIMLLANAYKMIMT